MLDRRKAASSISGGMAGTAEPKARAPSGLPVSGLRGSSQSLDVVPLTRFKNASA